MDWIRRSVRKLLSMWGLTSIGGAVLLLCSAFIYNIWIGEEVIIPFSLSVLCFLYAIIQNWNNVFAYSINGIGALKVSLLCSFFGALIYIPIAICLGRVMGVQGIVLALCLVLFISSVVQPIQLRKLISGHAHGLWRK